jgi:hypothetical protein
MAAHAASTWLLAALSREGRGALLYVAKAEMEGPEVAQTDPATPHDALLRATRRSHVAPQILRALGVSSVCQPERC